MPRARRRGGLFAIPDQLLNSPANYYAALIVDVAGAAIFFLMGLRTPISPIARLAVVAAGLAAWSLFEYAMHRWVGHGPSSFPRRGHVLHHSDHRALISAPVFFVMAGAFTIWAVVALLTGTDLAALLVCGLYIGYNQYALVHHVLHHHDPLTARPWLQRLERRHRIHHANHRVNFGVTSAGWDRVFGTYQPDTFSKTIRS